MSLSVYNTLKAKYSSFTAVLKSQQKNKKQLRRAGIMKFLIRFLSFFVDFFSKAGATGHVFTLKNGKSKSKGVAWSGFVGTKDTIALVPTVPLFIDFLVNARTSDKQGINVSGNVTIQLNPETAVGKFDFTVTSKGVYTGDWMEQIKSMVIQKVLNPVRTKAKNLSIEDATASHAAFSEAITTEIGKEGNELTASGISVVACSITRAVAVNDEVQNTIGAKELQEKLTASDEAAHNRRMKAAENDRKVKEYEVETSQEVEKKKEELIAQQIKNKQTLTEGEAEAIKKLLEPYQNKGNGEIFALAILELSKNGRIGNLSITPELMAFIKEQVK